jgi:carbonic anhydrase
MPTYDANPQALARLLDGVQKFQREIYPERAEIYRKSVGQVQRPHTLFIACADSRIDPELITQCGPGEIFVCRNIGNIVPAYGEMLGGVSAVLEYAVMNLGVDQVIVCGHTDCGAMKALIQYESLATLPVTKGWLRNAEAALSVARGASGGGGEEHEPPDENSPDLLKKLTEENVLLQMMHLRTHPSVAGKIARRKLSVYGWIYDIANGDVRIHDFNKNQFLAIDQFTEAVHAFGMP